MLSPSILFEVKFTRLLSNFKEKFTGSHANLSGKDAFGEVDELLRRIAEQIDEKKENTQEKQKSKAAQQADLGAIETSPLSCSPQKHQFRSKLSALCDFVLGETSHSS
jgi:hypothetical protein